MSTHLALFPASLKILRATGRLDTLPSSYLFSGFDRTLCICLSNVTEGDTELALSPNFTLCEIGLRSSGWGKAGAIMKVAKAISFLIQKSRALTIDAVIAYDPHLLGLIAAGLSRALGVPYAIRLICHYELKYKNTGHISFGPFVSRRVERAVERWTYRRAVAVLVACPSHSQYVLEVAGNGTPVLPYVTAQAAAFYEDAPADSRAVREEIAPGIESLAVAVTRLQPEKYPQDLIECARLLRNRKDFKLVILGDGDMRKDLEHLQFEHNSPVVFAGMQPMNRVRSMFATAEVAIILQGGGAITEAALCGTPIVAYDFEMNPHVVRQEHGEGVLVPFRDRAALAAAIGSILDDPERARQMGERAKAAARRRFSEAAARAAEHEIALRMTGASPITSAIER